MTLIFSRSWPGFRGRGHRETFPFLSKLLLSFTVTTHTRIQLWFHYKHLEFLRLQRCDGNVCTSVLAIEDHKLGVVSGQVGDTGHKLTLLTRDEAKGFKVRLWGGAVHFGKLWFPVVSITM